MRGRVYRTESQHKRGSCSVSSFQNPSRFFLAVSAPNFCFVGLLRVMLAFICTSSCLWLATGCCTLILVSVCVKIDNCSESLACCNHVFVLSDSLVFISKPGHADPPTGNFLGDLTDELKPWTMDRGVRFSWWVFLGKVICFCFLHHNAFLIFTGPKSYAYVTNDGKSVVKVKGFTLDGNAERVINFPSMMSMLLNRNVVSVQYDHVLKRVKRKFAIEETDLVKRFRVTYDKRRIVDSEWNTLPYGFCSR